MAGKYKGPVAFGFDPADCFWTDERAFEKFVIRCFKGDDPDPEDDYSGYEGMGFKLADHRDTADSYERSDSVEEFVEENIDFSTCDDTSIIDAYIIEDEARLVVSIISSPEDIAEIKNWGGFEPYETMTLERIDEADSDDIYELIYHIDEFNPTEPVCYREGKKIGNRMTEAAARTRLSVELRQFVSRFVNDLNTTYDIKDYDERMDASAELAIKIADWVGLPTQILPFLNYILADDCLGCDMWDLVNHIVKKLNK